MIIQYIIVAALVVLAAFCAFGYLALRKQLAALAVESANSTSATEKVAELTKQLETFRSRIEELERRKSVPFNAPAAAASAAAASAAPAPSTVMASANRRGQVMRLYRSGESVSSIASALGISQGEVKLMVKVQELLSENSNGESFPDFL